MINRPFQLAVDKLFAADVACEDFLAISKMNEHVVTNQPLPWYVQSNGLHRQYRR